MLFRSRAEQAPQENTRRFSRNGVKRVRILELGIDGHFDATEFLGIERDQFDQVTALANGQVKGRPFAFGVDARNVSEEAIAPADLLRGGDGIALLIEESSQNFAESFLRKDGAVPVGS